MGVNWTDEQREAIEYRGGNILLAAAAGSGKTAVLVQRIIELINPPEKSGKDSADISELLVLTFTDAAASEMRAKISAAVSRALDENPYDPHLHRQSLLIHSASISTVHSFCLNILKSNIHLTNLPADFSLVTEEENGIMLKQALDDVLEMYYGRIDKDWSFKSLALGYGGVKNDSGLREMVLSLLKYAKSMAYPAKWLSAAIAEYRRAAKYKTISGGVWSEKLREITENIGRDVKDIYAAILREADMRLFEDHKYNTFFADEAERINALFENIDGGDYCAAKEKLGAFVFAKLPTVRGADEETAAVQNTIKSMRTRAKKCIEELQNIYEADGDTVVERAALTYPRLRTLKNIVLTVDRRHTRMKRSKNYLDFGDLEHEALKLLDAGGGEPSEAAAALRKKYREILVDEYQDTNNIQDTIFKIISRKDSNIFMVGDLKQSIYKFRNAVPALFSQKYESYGKDGERGHLIRLFKNFRSRESVVNTVNFVFREVMSKAVGDIDYTTEEYLIQGANYPEVSDDWFDTELHMICRSGDEDEEIDKTELEARVAAERIQKIIGGGMTVFDKETGQTRPAEYRDIVILMRNTKNTAPIFERVLSDCGIPVYTDTGRSYLGSLEVQTVLSFLQIIDNPLRDIPLIAVMRSPIFGFSPDELAKLRTNMRKGSFYAAVLHGAESGDEKAAQFVKTLDDLRSCAEYTGVDRLVWEIYYDCGYYAYVGSLSRGAERQANLRLLFERAAEFEHTKLSGLFSFMNYIESLKNEKNDLAPAKIFGEGDSVVRIMSIHKSKGLEFPIVILADTAHRFNAEDVRKNILWNENIGIGADYTDSKIRVRYPSLPRKIISHIAKSEMLSEEMRLLYVALTRAREKLIITATYTEREKNWREPQYGGDGKALSGWVRSSACFRDWLAAAFMRHPDAELLRDYCGSTGIESDTDAAFRLTVSLYEDISAVPMPEKEEQKLETIETRGGAADFDREIAERIGYEYPNRELSNIPVKMSVSEVKRMQSDDGEYVPMLEGLSFSGVAEPGEIQAAERGTIVHFVLQYADEKKMNTEEDSVRLLESMQANGVLTAAQAACVNPSEIIRFFQSTLGKRMKSAERVEKEFSFYTETDAAEIYGGETDGKILLQGTIDCFMISGGKVVLIDFKTDSVHTKEAAKLRAENYKVQMKYYQKGLCEILKRPVDECYIYFLSCGETVAMEIY